MGEPVKIVDLARDLVRLSGLRPDEDIAIEVSGIRPGEKLFEELSTDGEVADKTKHPKIFIGRIAPTSWNDIQHRVDELAALVDTSDDGDKIRKALHGIVPEYTGAKPAAVPTGEAIGTEKPRRVGDTTGNQLVIGA
jgi:FlaA1/EpsC-like NDP-sugar epimerase